MPIYEFRCTKCAHQFEELVFRRSEIEELTCPKCGAQQVSQLLSTFSSAGGSKSEGGGASRCAPGSFT